jgi:hypothetical protein
METVTAPVIDPTPSIITGGVSRTAITFRDAAPTPPAENVAREAQGFGDPGFGDPSRTVIWPRHANPQDLGDPSRTVIWDRDANAKAQGFGDPSRTVIIPPVITRTAIIGRNAQELGDPSRTDTLFTDAPPVETRSVVWGRGKEK